MGLGDETYVLLTTYRRSGVAVDTVVWSAPLDDGAFGFWTSSGSGKAKRLAHTQRVVVQPCDARGNVAIGSAPANGTARLVAAGDPQYDEIQRKIKDKYGFQARITKLLGSIGGIVKGNRIPYGDRGVVISLD